MEILFIFSVILILLPAMLLIKFSGVKKIELFEKDEDTIYKYDN